MSLRPGWWTPFTFLFPWRYVETGEPWSSLDLDDWSADEYDWIADDWNGFKDFASPPRETLDLGEGDCEDYALVAASWALTHGRDGVGIAFCIEKPRVWPTHVIAFDEERVYSSGYITTQSVDSWLDNSDYDYALRRRIDPARVRGGESA